MTLTPGGAHAYVINHCSLPLIDRAIDESPRIVVGDLPRCVPISPDGKRAYVSGFGDHTASVIDAITDRVTNTLDVGGHREGLAVSPDGDRPFVGDYWRARSA